MRTNKKILKLEKEMFFQQELAKRWERAFWDETVARSKDIQCFTAQLDCADRLAERTSKYVNGLGDGRKELIEAYQAYQAARNKLGGKGER